MSTASASRAAVASNERDDDDVASQRAVVVYNCTRIGRKANPPGFSLSNLFRFGRWR